MRKIFWLPLLAIRAETEEIQTVICDFKTGLLGHLRCHLFHFGKLGINYDAALGADHIWVGKRPVTIVT